MSSRAVVESAIDAYEEAIRRTSDAQRGLAGRVPFEPLRVILRASADLTRDIGAIQLSGVRWLLDA
jgi:hypothetical protein